MSDSFHSSDINDVFTSHDEDPKSGSELLQFSSDCIEEWTTGYSAQQADDELPCNEPYICYGTVSQIPVLVA